MQAPGCRTGSTQWQSAGATSRAWTHTAHWRHLPTKPVPKLQPKQPQPPSHCGEQGYGRADVVPGASHHRSVLFPRHRSTQPLSNTLQTTLILQDVPSTTQINLEAGARCWLCAYQASAKATWMQYGFCVQNDARRHPQVPGWGWYPTAGHPQG